MKVLITGGAGYIGGTVCRLLLGQGHGVTVYDNLCHSKRLAVAEAAEFVEGDVADRTLLEKTLRAGRFDGVMHFAALIEAGESMKHPEIYFRNNTAATLTLLEAMLATGHDRLVFSSTAACYGEPESTPILEDAKLQPTNPYGESKLLVEDMLRATLARDGKPAPPEGRIWGTAATVTASILNGAHIVRVHDVNEIVQVARVADCLLDPKRRLN